MKQPPIQLEATRWSRERASRPNRLKRKRRLNSGLAIQVSITNAKISTITGKINGSSARVGAGDAGQESAAEEESRE